MGFSLRVSSEERTLKARNNGCKVNDKRHRNHSHQLYSLFEILIKIMKKKMLEASRIQGVLSTKKNNHLQEIPPECLEVPGKVFLALLHAI